MKNMAKFCATTVFAFSVLACNQQPDTHDADVAAIKTGETEWVQDYAAKDADKATAHYADDATLMSPGMDAVTGKAAIGTVIKQMVGDPAFSLKFETTKTEVAKSGDVAFTQGTYTMSMTNLATKQVIHDHGNYVTTYKKQADGSWKAVSDIATSAVPPPMPAPAAPAKKKK
jgi:uncharacterized protein (TIGR02246 family)